MGSEKAVYIKGVCEGWGLLDMYVMVWVRAVVDGGGRVG